MPTAKTIKGPKYTVMQQEGYHLPMPVEKVSQSDSKMVSYGDGNRYPQYLWELYESTAIFQTLVNNLLDYICGDSIDVTLQRTGELAFFDQSPAEIADIVRKCALDYIIYNACSVQRIRNSAGFLVKIAYLDQTKVRYDETVQNILYHKDWKAYSKDYLTIPLDDPKADTDAVTFRAVCKGVYPTPLYNGAMKSIVIANKIDTYHLNNLSNGFSASYLLSFNNGVPDNVTKDKIERELKDKFAGEGNAGKFVVSWNESKENEATVAPIPTDSFDAKYQALRTNYEQNIVVAFRCPAQLLGFSTQNTTFNTIEYVAAFDLYNRTMVKPMQQHLLGFFDRIMGKHCVDIAPYVIRFDTSDYDSNKPLQ